MARAHHTTLPESEPQEAASRATAPVAIDVPRRGGAETWLTVGGVLMMLVGIALVVVPTFLPQYGWVVRSLAARGVTSLPIAIGGVLMCGIAFAGRSSRANLDVTASAISAARETSPAIAALAQQIATLGDGLQAIRIEFVYLKDALQSQFDRMQQSTPQTQDSGAGDAVYRLAASLDQVGMRIEERFNAGHRELGESVRALATSLETLRDEHANLRTTLEEVRERAPEAKVEPAEAEEELYADGWNPEDEDRSARLGLLDMLDDLGRLLPAKSPDVADEPALEPDPFTSAQDEGWKHSGSIPPALPRPRAEELRMADTKNLLGRSLPHSEPASSQGIVGEKLEELRDLLADERVRQALAALERTRR